MLQHVLHSPLKNCLDQYQLFNLWDIPFSLDIYVCTVLLFRIREDRHPPDLSFHRILRIYLSTYISTVSDDCSGSSLLWWHYYSYWSVVSTKTFNKRSEETLYTLKSTSLIILCLIGRLYKRHTVFDSYTSFWFSQYSFLE